MDDDLLEKSLDVAILTDVVRQDQRDPSFELTEWHAKRLSDKGIANPDGLWLLYGQGKNSRDICPWSVVLKIVERHDEDLPVSDLWYWKREYLFAQSRLTEDILVQAPRFYSASESSEGAWIWMEYLVDHHPGKWTLDEYVFAAHQLGLWNSIYLTGKPLPTEDWLTRQHYRSWLGEGNPEEPLEFPLNQKYISKEMQIQYLTLWNERETFFKVLEDLPQVFSHFDSQRRNLLIHMINNNQEELVALDWQQCGIGAVGAELNWMVGIGGALLEWPPSDLAALDKAVFQSYVAGLQEGGWSGDIDIVRLGYVAMLAVFVGCAFPGLTTFWCSRERRDFALQILGLAGEELLIETLPIFHYALGCADEARSLMKKLKYL